MVRPGFYLGRAYAGKAFLLNFVLYNKDDRGARRRGVRARPARSPRTAGRARSSAPSSPAQVTRWRSSGAMRGESCGRDRLRSIAAAAHIGRARAEPASRRRVGDRPVARRARPAAGGPLAVRCVVTREATASARHDVPFPSSAWCKQLETRGRLRASRARAGADPARTLAAAHRGRTRRSSSSRASSPRSTSTGRGRRAAAQGSAVPRLSGEERPDRGDQLQRSGRALRVPGRQRLSRGAARAQVVYAAARCASPATRITRRSSRARCGTRPTRTRASPRVLEQRAAQRVHGVAGRARRRRAECDRRRHRPRQPARVWCSCCGATAAATASAGERCRGRSAGRGAAVLR